MVYGNERISGVRKKFQDLLSQVQRGVEELNRSKNHNTREIDALLRDNNVIDSELEAARNLETALKQFIPEGVK